MPPRARRPTDVHRYRFLLSRGWIVALLFCLCAAAICVMLAFWQGDRYSQKVERAETVERNYDAEPRPLPAVVPEPGHELAPGAEWQPVEVTGTYDADAALYVRNRPLGDEIGFYQVVPFELSDGSRVLVNRGWVPGGAEGAPAESPDPPTGEIDLVGRVRPAEDVPPGRENPPGQLQSVTPTEAFAVAGETSGSDYTSVYLDLAAEDPAGEAATPLPEPETGLGPHLSYEAQWFVFALFFLVGYVYYARQTARERDTTEAEERLEERADESSDEPAERTAVTGADPSGPEAQSDAQVPVAAGARASTASARVARYGGRRSIAPTRRRGRRSGTSDEEVEDALVDDTR